MRNLNDFLLKNNDTISQADLSELENILEKRLPKIYKDFMLESNGGELAYNKFKLTTTGKYSNLYSFISLTEITKSWGYLKDEPDFFNAELIPIAQTIGPAFISIGAGKDNFGKIFIIETDLEIQFQANDLVEFINQIEIEQPIKFPPRPS